MLDEPVDHIPHKIYSVKICIFKLGAVLVVMSFQVDCLVDMSICTSEDVLAYPTYAQEIISFYTIESLLAATFGATRLSI